MGRVLQMLGSEHKELLEDGKVLLYTRNGIFYARVYKGDRWLVLPHAGTRLAQRFITAHTASPQLLLNLPRKIKFFIRCDRNFEICL